MGIELDGEEQLVWAAANTHAETPLDEEDIQAILAEHTEPAEDGDPEWRKIPAADFERAGTVLSSYIYRHVKLLDYSVGAGISDYGVIGELEASARIAVDLQNTIHDDFAPR